MYTDHSCHLLVLMYHVSFIEPFRKFPPFRGWLSFCQHVTEESVFGKVGVKMWVNDLVENFKVRVLLNLLEEGVRYTCWVLRYTCCWLRAYDKKMSHALVDTILGKQGKVTTTWRYHFLVNFDDYCDFLNYFPSVFWYPRLPSFSLYFVLLIFMIFFFFPFFFFFYSSFLDFPHCNQRISNKFKRSFISWRLDRTLLSTRHCQWFLSKVLRT